MIIDEIDEKIFLEFLKLNGKESTSWNLMKKVYSNGNRTEHMRIIKKIEKMSRSGLIFISGKPKKYILIKDYVRLKKYKNPENKLKNFLCIKEENKWFLIEV